MVRHSRGAAVTLPKRISRANLLHMNTANYPRFRTAQSQFRGFDLVVSRYALYAVAMNFEGKERELGFAERVSAIEGCVL